jgi:hypothetical protein
MHALLLALIAGCADPLADAQRANTIEAWEAYLATNPEGSDKMVADARLMILLTERARKDKTLAAYDAVIKRYPKHREIKTLKEERCAIAFTEAEATNTAEGWKKFLDENPDASKGQKDRARGFVAILDYGGIQMGEIKMEQVNLAENPKGPKDGWGFQVSFTNAGSKDIEYMNIEIRYLDDQGRTLSSEKWPLVAQSGPGGMPVSEATTKPLKAGQSRVWDYSTGNVPSNWGKQVKIYPVAVRFVGTAANDGAQEEKSPTKKKKGG